MTRSPHRWTRVALAAALALAAACGGEASTSGSASTTASTGATAPARPTVTVADAWARTSPSMTTRGAAYLTLTSNVGDRLTGARVPASVAARTEIHETVAKGTPPGPLTAPADESLGESGAMASTTTATMAMAMPPTTTMAGMAGMGTGAMGSAEMEMRRVTAIELPAGQAVPLRPGGFHLMLIDLAAPLAAGSQFELTLTFEKAGEQPVTVPVRAS